MTKLKYKNETLWDRLNFDDFRPRFFIECYIEKLRLHTPHFYQSRLLNIFSACAEMNSHINAYQENDKNSAYITVSMEEVIDCWETDSIAQEILIDFIAIKSEIAKINKSNDFNSNTLNHLKSFCRAISNRRDLYESKLLEQLKESILGDTDLNQRDRITQSIDKFTGLYTTLLLNRGYSPTYLFNRSDMFTYENQYSGRKFSEQFELVTQRLKTQKISFDVYYGFHTARPNDILKIDDDPNLKFLETVPVEITGSHLEKLKKDIEINVIAHANLISTDYVTAALRTKEYIYRFLDTETAFEFGNDFEISKYCVTLGQGQKINIKSLNVDVLHAFLSSENGTTIPHSNISIRQIFKTLDETAKEHLGRSLRHLRLAKNSTSLEQKLLNLWISLESLFFSADSSIISNILEYVPQFYAITGISRRVTYLRELLVSNDIETTPIINSEICVGMDKFDSSTSDDQVFLILRNEDAAKELFSSLGNKDHLKFKLMRIFSEIKDNKAISARLNRSEADVQRQLRRIYFLRNKIAHTGHFDGVRPQLVTHLLDYVAISYRVISEAARKTQSNEKYSISELLSSARMGVDIIKSKVNSKEEIRSLSNLILNPVI